MANNKTYAVMKDGETIKELKTLAAAKRLADAEDAEVFCEGLCVYAPDPPVSGEELLAKLSDAVVEPPVVETVMPEKYTLTAKMNSKRCIKRVKG